MNKMSFFIPLGLLVRKRRVLTDRGTIANNFKEEMIMTVATSTKVRSNTAMHNLYYASKKTAIGCKTASFDQEVKNEDKGIRASSTTESYSNSKAIYEQMGCNNKPIPTNYDNNLSNSSTITRGLTQVSEWPNEDTFKPAFITFNSGLTGYDTVEYFYDLSSDEDNPTMYMRTKTGNEENYYKLDLNSINPASASKAEMLGYYSYMEYKGEDVDMYQLMADMDMAEHNAYVSTSDNLQAAFLEYKANWIKALQDVLNIQKDSGDSKGAAATQGLLHFMNSTKQVSEE
jgi:hypothetical protein